MKRIVAGIVAHVDAGKTTLSEALLYRSGEIRRLGRVDHGDAFLDTDELEKARGITISAHQALVEHAGLRLTLLDTPGHVDFAAETERVLRVLDVAVLVVSGIDGVQGHTETLWRLLERYGVPTFLFVNKCDAPGFDRDAVLAQLRSRLGDAVFPLPAVGEEADAEAPVAAGAAGIEDLADLADETVVPFGDEVEDIAALDEQAMDEYFDSGAITLGRVRAMIASRELFPVFFGSALRLDGVGAFLDGLAAYTGERRWPSDFGARVFKISHDDKHNRLTWLRVTGGTLKAKSWIGTDGGADADGGREKIDQVRVYNGARFEIAGELPAGAVCAVTGLRRTFPGQGLGMEPDAGSPSMQPVLTYTVLPASAAAPAAAGTAGAASTVRSAAGGTAGDMESAGAQGGTADGTGPTPKPRFDDLTLHRVLTALRELEDEDPLLRVAWLERLQEVHVQLMGVVQLEIVQQTLRERFGLDVVFGAGSILYRETITAPIEGVGHFEPLRHYAEAHILIEPGEPGSGVHVASAMSVNDLDRNWQRLILTHLSEREHLGVLTGSPLTDVRMTLVAARAHLKHTEGGDFRQATYRAIRQGLMEARAGVEGHAVVGRDTTRPEYEIDDDGEPQETNGSGTQSAKPSRIDGSAARGNTADDGARAEAAARMAKAVAADPGNCRVLEPWYRFRLEVPQDMLGRAMSDIQRMSGTFETPQGDGDYALIEGAAPVSEMRDYAMDVNAYTHGRGRLSATFGGYRPCHDQARVIEQATYDPESDLDNTPDSVFCAHGAGYPVKWYKVPEFMHLGYATA